MKKILFGAALIAVSFTTFAQVGVGTTTPDASAALDVASTDKGFLPPRMTKIQVHSIASPAEGLLVYCSNCSPKGLFVHNGTEFVSITTGTASVNPIAAIVAASSNPAADETPSLADLAAVGLTNLTGTQIEYEEAIADAVPAPTTVAELQAIIDDVNVGNAIAAIVAASTNPAADDIPSLADLAAVGLTNLTETQVKYEEAIADAVPAPTTVADLQAIIDDVNSSVVVAGQNGTFWMDRNLGATQQATSSADAASYGDLYQWGRSADGHQLRTSATSGTQLASGGTISSDFITGFTDWLSTPDDTLWQAGNNDPCPPGYRVPTETEFNNELLAFSSNNAAGAYNSSLKLPVAGHRNRNSGDIVNTNSVGIYWSSTIDGTSARNLNISNGNAIIGTSVKSNGFSVRCIKE